MLHFGYDPETFRKVVAENHESNKKDMFKSKLQNNMRVRKDVYEEGSSGSALKNENKNFVRKIFDKNEIGLFLE